MFVQLMVKWEISVTLDTALISVEKILIATEMAIYWWLWFLKSVLGDIEDKFISISNGLQIDQIGFGWLVENNLCIYFHWRNSEIIFNKFSTISILITLYLNHYFCLLHNLGKTKPWLGIAYVILRANLSNVEEPDVFVRDIYTEWNKPRPKLSGSAS